VTVWFTVQLEDRPGALADVARALADRGVNITGIVGVAEDTDGALMLTTSDAAATREAFTALGIAFDEHDPTSGAEPTGLSISDIIATRSG
jgi:hypothetical protein